MKKLCHIPDPVQSKSSPMLISDVVFLGIRRSAKRKNRIRKVRPVSREISDLCEISDLLVFFSYFASQNKEIKSGNYFFYVCCVN